MFSRMHILGIDPGSNITGFGIVTYNRRTPQYLTSGIIRTTSREMPQRLAEIYSGILEVIENYKPTIVAVEQVFVHKSAASAIKLAQARGVALAAAASHNLAIFEYAPRKIKQMVVGYGNATKEQVQLMVKNLLKLDAAPSSDAADALAVALCHGSMLGVSA